MRSTERRVACVALASLVLSIGCSGGEEIGVVEGVVTYNGNPVPDVSIYFRDHDRGIHIMAHSQEDGSYSVFTAGGEGLPLGEYRVSVVPPGRTADVDRATGRLVNVRAADGLRIPDRYQDVSTSGLSTVVKSGHNEFDIAMSDG